MINATEKSPSETKNTVTSSLSTKTCTVALNSTETNMSELTMITTDDTNFTGEKLHKLNATCQDNVIDHDDNHLSVLDKCSEDLISTSSKQLMSTSILS